MDDELLIHGEVDFKRGIMSRWRNVYCTVQPRSFSVYDGKTCDNKLYTFTPEKSWISAANKADSGLFVLNLRSRRAGSVKSSELFLFDTKEHNILLEWLKGLQKAGWKSAVPGDRLRYHHRSIDEFANRDKIENPDKDETSFDSMLRTQDSPTVDVPISDSNNNEAVQMKPVTVESGLTFTNVNKHYLKDNSSTATIEGKKQEQLETRESPQDSAPMIRKDLLSVDSSSDVVQELLIPEERVAVRILPDSTSASVASNSDPIFVNESSDLSVKSRSSDICVETSTPEATKVDTSFEAKNKIIFNSTEFSETSIENDLPSITSHTTDSNKRRNPDILIPDLSLSSCLSENDLDHNEKDEVTDLLETPNSELGEPSLLSEQIKDCVSVESGYCSKESLSICEESKQPASAKRVEYSAIFDTSTVVNDVEQSILEMPKENTEQISLVEDIPAIRTPDSMPVMSADIQNQVVVDDKPELLKRFQEINSSHDKLSKRQSMTNILTQFKNKISMKKQKAQKKQNCKALFSTKLLWRDGDEWKERWFKLQGHTLFCFKDSSMKTLDFSIDARKCTVALPEGIAWQGMNVFTLTTDQNEVYHLANWSDHHLQNWVKALEQFSNKGSYEEDDDLDDSLECIVPYNEALEIHQLNNLTSTESTDQETNISEIGKGQNDPQLRYQGSMDSGNDGDESESGLESSGASISGIKQFTSRRKQQSSRRKMGIDHTEAVDSSVHTKSSHIDEREYTPSKVDTLRTIPVLSEESSDLCSDSLASVTVQKRRTSSLQGDFTFELRPNPRSFSSITSLASMDTSRATDNSNGALQSPRSRQESLESSASSVGSPTEKVVVIDDYSSYRSHSTVVSSRKYSVDSCTSIESETESISSRKNTKLRLQLRKVEKTPEASKENGKDRSSEDEGAARRLLLSEVLMQRESASKNLFQRGRVYTDEKRDFHPRSYTVSDISMRKAVPSKNVHLQRVSSQGVLIGHDNWDVRIEKVSPVTEEPNTIQLHPLTPNTIKENYVSNFVDLKPISVDISTGETRQASRSDASEEDLTWMTPESQAELEKSVRNETLLRKRRNSLSLARDSILKRLESIQGKVNEDKENFDIVRTLEGQLEDVNKEIDSIESNLSLQHENIVEITKRKRKMAKRANAVFSRLRHPLSSRNNLSAHKYDSEGNLYNKDTLYKLRKRSTSSMVFPSNEGFMDFRNKYSYGRPKRTSTGSDPRADSSVSSIGSSVDLRNLEDDVVDGTPKQTGLKTRSRSVGNILQMNGNYPASFQASRPRQRKISQDAISKIEDFMEFSREMVNELKSRKNSEEITEVIEV